MKYCCEYCHCIGYHRAGCPNYTPPKAEHYCAYCGEGIFDGDDVICDSNSPCEYVHDECVPSTKWLIEWLGGESFTYYE